MQLPFKQRYFHPPIPLPVNKEFFNQSSFHFSNFIFSQENENALGIS